MQNLGPSTGVLQRSRPLLLYNVVREWYIFFLVLYLRSFYGGVILLHVAKVSAGSFANATFGANL